MKEVVQEDPMGCGVACVAFVLGESYVNALSLFRNGSKKAPTVGFSCKSIVNALNSTGLKYRHRSVKNENENYSSGSIVFIDYSEEYPYGHFLAKAGDGWMDPWLNIHSIPRKAGFRDKLPGKPIYVIEAK